MRSPAAVLFLLVFAAPAFGQGQDSTPAARNLQIIAELLPGTYDNANQNYFDVRLKVDEALQHARTNLVVERIDDTANGEPVFRYQATEGDGPATTGTVSLALDGNPRLVRMRISSVDQVLEGCDILWRRGAGQFTGTSDCGLQMQLDPGGLWIGWQDEKPPYELTRARMFSCYVDIPGVAGGRNEPFDRYSIEQLQDQGGMEWLRTKDGRDIGINLRNVQWPMNNEVGAFTRNSLVLYVLERTTDGVKTHTYGWTEPRAERIGLNLQWLLVNCYRVSNRDVQPFFD